MKDLDQIKRLHAELCRDLGLLRERSVRYDPSANAEDRSEHKFGTIRFYLTSAIKQCAKIAHGIIAAEQFPAAKSDVDAVRKLAKKGIIPPETAEQVVQAIEFAKVPLVWHLSTPERDSNALHKKLALRGGINDYNNHVSAWISRQ